MTQKTEQPVSPDLEEIRLARAEILHLAEPEDPYLHWAVEALGPVYVADIFAGRTPLTPQDFRERLADTTTDSEAQKLYEEVQKRVLRWENRRVPYPLSKEISLASKIDSWLLIPEDDDWPAGLADLGATEPFALWGRGERSRLSQFDLSRSVAVVGARDTTSYGNSATAHIAGDLAAQGITIVSGGAFGIDAVAHRCALASSTASLPTVALMAGGIDRAYPKQNEPLIREIYRQGLVLSEVPLGFQPTRWRFLQRNRLIAALAAMTIVVEARWRSGALNTANHALEIGREVGAVPGQIFSPNSEGCHRLIRKGYATPVLSAQGVLEDLSEKITPYQEESLFETEREQTPQLSQMQERIWDCLPLRKHAPIESISAMSGVGARSTMLALSQLSQLGLAEQDAGGWRKSKGHLKPS